MTDARETNAAEIVSRMTLEEKASLCSGLDVWHTKAVDRLGVSSFMMADGPHGLRKQAHESDHLGLHESVPATCFPTSSATASSFDRALMFEIGQAIAEECLQEEVSLLLGPGINIKRSPLCGRNFEYFSEDPYLIGEMAAVMINGIQSKQIGTCLKHYALNNQETGRMITDSVVDERAKREIYLAGFETAVKYSRPWTLMCSYNRIDGVYASDNKNLLTDILRDEWGFKGAVVTDWGAMNDRVLGVKAGLDLEMPPYETYNDQKIVDAVKQGQLLETDLDKVAVRMVELAQKSMAGFSPDYRYDTAGHHALARRAAAESCVLLKNDNELLPVKAGQSIAVIGKFAKQPRYQGSGSSKINPLRIDSVFDTLTNEGIAFEYADGYSLDKYADTDDQLIQEACEIARNKDTVLLFAGLPDEYESEGFDRNNLDMPKAHNDLIEAVRKANPRTAVILLLGAPVIMPWQNDIDTILVTYLGGEAGGSGCADVLFGKVNPGGHLAETWPSSLEDTSCYRYFPGNPKSVEYRESIFVGYRYYDAANIDVAWPFGHGLSYTHFAYSNLVLSNETFAAGEKLEVSFTIENVGTLPGSDVAQLYIGKKESTLFRAPQELKGFEKVFLAPGESTRVSIELDDRSFAYYNAPHACWAIEEGEYTISVGESSRNICLSSKIYVKGDGLEASLAHLKEAAPEYFALGGSGSSNSSVNRESLCISDASFETLLGHSIPPTDRLPGEPFTVNSTLTDVKDTFVGKRIYAFAIKNMKKVFEDDEATLDIGQSMFMEMPLRAIGLFSGGMLTPTKIDGVVDMVNGKLFKGLAKFLRKE